MPGEENTMYQQITVIGNLGRDPESKQLPSGKTCASCSLAASRSLGQGQKETTWFAITAYDHSATYLLNYARKGSKVLVIGRLKPGPDGQPRAWLDKSSQPRSAYEITVSELKIIEGYKGDEAQPAQDQDFPVF